MTSHLYNEDRTSLGHASGGSDLATETAVSSTGHGSPEGKIPSLTSTSHSATRDTDPDTGYCGADSTSGEQGILSFEPGSVKFARQSNSQLHAFFTRAHKIFHQDHQDLLKDYIFALSFFQSTAASSAPRCLRCLH